GYVSNLDAGTDAGMTLFRRPGWAAVAIMLAAILTAFPLWCVTSPAMPDYPAHLATYYLLATGAKAQAVAQFYRIEWAFIPNLAGEILVPLLAKLTALEVATKLFITAGIVMWVVGPALIHRALYGRAGAAPLIAAIFAYNANLMWGFLNYYFAMGFGFLVFAAWITMENRRTPMRLAGFALAVTILYFCHLFACETLALMMGSYELGAWSFPPRPPLRQMWRRLGAAGIVFVPAALALLFLKPHNPDADSDVTFNFMDTWLDRATAALQHHH